MHKLAATFALATATLLIAVPQQTSPSLVIMSLQDEIPDVSILAQLDEAALKNALVHRNYEVHKQSGILFAIPNPNITIPRIAFPLTIVEALRNQLVNLDQRYLLGDLPNEIVTALERTWGSESVGKIASDVPIEFAIEIRCRVRDAFGKEHQATVAQIRGGTLRPILQHREPPSSEQSSEFSSHRSVVSASLPSARTPSLLPTVHESELPQPPSADIASMRIYFVRIPENRREETAKKVLDLSLQQRVRVLERHRKLTEELLNNLLSSHKVPVGKVAVESLPPVLRESLGDFLTAQGISLNEKDGVEIEADLVMRVPRRLGSGYYLLGVPIASTGQMYTVIPR